MPRAIMPWIVYAPRSGNPLTLQCGALGYTGSVTPRARIRRIQQHTVAKSKHRLLTM